MERERNLWRPGGVSVGGAHPARHDQTNRTSKDAPRGGGNDNIGHNGAGAQGVAQDFVRNTGRVQRAMVRAIVPVRKSPHRRFLVS